MSSKDDSLQIRPGRIRQRGKGSGKRAKGFIAQVLAAAQKSGHVGPRREGPPPTSFGRGRVATWRAERWLLSAQSRRVVVKARVVRHGPRTAPMRAHLAYLKREGVTKAGDKAKMFDATHEVAEDGGFAQRCEGDRHHFRFTVSPEDGGDLTDLRAFTRDLMAQMERDLMTRLDWVALDHWNTDNPHIHVLVRGRTDQGETLLISRDYISRGMRARAMELATLELGPRSEWEIRLKLTMEVTAERWTRLDQAVARVAENGIADLRPGPNDRTDPHLRRLMIGRLQHLERLGLAKPLGPAQWSLAETAETTLRDLGLRGDIVKTMHRALAGQGIERAAEAYMIDGTASSRVVGRLIGKGLDDELTGSAYVIIDGVDGQVHRLRLAGLADLDHAPAIGGILESEVGSKSRRLQLRTLSDLPLDRQVTASGATWLDRELVGRDKTLMAETGFGTEVREALSARTDHLAREGLARHQGSQVVFARDLLATLRERELSATVTAIAGKTGLEHRPIAEGEPVSGLYRRRVDLASGRYALIEDGQQFVLVPWRPIIERHLGREVSGLVRAGGAIDWTIGHGRGMGIG